MNKKLFLLQLIFLQTILVPKLSHADPDNKIFKNIRAINWLLGRKLNITENAIIGQDLLINGNEFINGNSVINGNLTINGTINNASTITTQLPVDTNELVRFADNTGTKIKGSQVTIDNSGNINNINNIEISGVTKNGNTVTWPSGTGALGTFLGSDGAGNLIYDTPAGAGDVTALALFSTDNRILTTASTPGKTIKQSAVTISPSGDISNVGSLTSNSVSTNGITITGGGNITGNLIGNVLGNVTGASSLNVLKAGDTMTGNLTMANTAIRLQDFSGTKYVGLKAPTAIGTSYNLNLPANAPLSSQFLQASSPTNLQWATINGSPSSTQAIYVSKSGSDSNDGSIVSPFLTVAHAVTVANGIASYPLNPVTINIGPGIFFENPMTINTNYIFLVGQSIIGTTIAPADPTQNLITIASPYSFFGILNMSFTCYGVSSATALSITTNSPGFIELNNISLNQFQTAIQIGGVAGSAFVLATNIQGINNGTNIAINNAQISLKNGNFVGGTDLITPANTGITANGSDTIAYISDSTFALLNTGISVINNATFNLLGSNFRTNINSIVANGTSDTLITSCQFSLNDPTTTNITASDSGTKFYIEGCLFDCEDASDNPQGTCVKAYNGAKVTLANSIIDEAIIGIDCGQAGEAAPATVTSSDTSLKECSTGIKQVNSSKIYFTGGKFDSTKLNIAIPTNCLISSFDVSGNLSFGSKTDIQNTLYEVLNGQANSPELTYVPNYYGYKGTIFKNSNTGTNGAAINATQSDLDNAAYFVVTGDNTKEAKISLISDSNTIGAAGSDRGWDITKLSSAELAFKYFDNDPGAVRGLNTVMQLNGYDNQVEFPVSSNTPLPTNATGAKLVWAPSLDGNSTNLYRSATGTLTTDASFTVGGTLTVPDSAAGTPTINFDGMTGTGFSAQSNTLSLNTAGAQRMSINPTGAVFVNSFSGGASGVVHASTAGQLTNSLIIGSDIAANTIPDSKLQTISSSGKVLNSATTATNSNIVSTIVSRGLSGEFSAGTITATQFNGPLSGNVIGNVTGALYGNANSATVFTTALTGDLSGGNNGSTSTVVKVGGQLAADIANATILATQATSANTPGAIVRRDGFGNFEGTTITATGGFIGNVTGSLFGNANTATYATNAGQALNATGFSGPLAGDVTGTQSATVVSYVGGATGSYIASGAKLANDATSNDVINTIVKRDGSGRFATDMITLNGTVSALTDAATKDYVDTQVLTGGLDPKTPARVIETTSNVTLSGTTTIDSVSVIALDRVLLNAQTTTSENGLWVVQAGAWTRPTDFNTGNLAGKAYVLITEGTVNGGSSWICDTPLATIDTNPISFVLFSLPSSTTAANLGTGAGQVFKNKTGNTINLRTLAALSTYVTVATNVTNNTVDIDTNATSSNTPSTIIARDANGYFSATGMTGVASGNVKLTGDTMTGNLNMATQSEIRLQDAAGGEYIGLRAPSAVGASYTLDLPTGAPAANQFLQATSATNTQWSTIGGGSPSVARTFYVSLAGSDSNDGSFAFPFRHVSYAVQQANAISSTANPVAIFVGPGVFVEDNTGGAIAISADGISIVGSSISSTIIKPTDTALGRSTNLFSSTYSNLTFESLALEGAAGGSTAAAFVLSSASGGSTTFQSVSVKSFQTGLSFNKISGANPTIIVKISSFTNNNTCIAINDLEAFIKNNVLHGPLSGSTPTNTAITVTGSNADGDLANNTFLLFDTGVSVTGDAKAHIMSSIFQEINNSITCNGGSWTQITACNFVLNNASTININASGAGTTIYVEGCIFDCDDAADNRQGTALKVTDNAKIIANNSTVSEALIGIECGQLGVSDSTSFIANGLNLLETTTDIKQFGNSSLSFVSGSIENSFVEFENASGVSMAAFNSNGETTLSFGNTTDTEQAIYKILNSTGPSLLPNLHYMPDYYEHKGTVYHNPDTQPTFNATQSDSNDAAYYVVTGDATKETKISLISDSNNIGATGNDRGWEITKLSGASSTGAELAFKYFDNDPGAVRGLNTVMQLNGYDNQIEFPVAANTPLPTNATGAKLVWAPSLDGNSTNLYRSATGTLTTDASFTVGGTLTLPDSAAGTPTINFDGMTGTGFSAQSNTLSLNTAGAQRMSINPTGAVFVNSFSGGASGVVHASTTGQLTNSLIIGNDIAANTIPDSKLQTISTAGKVANSATTATNSGAVGATGTIVMRQAVTGNFDTIGVITANTAAKGFVGNLQGNADTATSATTAGSATNFTGTLSGDVMGTQSTTHVNTVATLNASGASSPVYTGITAANAATPNNTPNTIVKRDAGGNFTATAITASLTGAASLNVLKAGDTMTGPLAINYASSSATTPSLSIGTTGAGIYSDLVDTISIETAGVQRLNIGSTGAVSVNSLLDVAGPANFASGVNITGGLNVTGPANFATGVTFAAASEANPSIKFDGSTNTGFSAATANRISIDTSGTERMFVGPDVTSSALGIGRLLPVFDQAIQLENTSPIAVNATTSILIYSGAGNFTISNFPANPANGQLFTIMLGVTDTVTHAINYPANTVATNNNITALDANSFTGTSGGKSVTYIYLPTGGTTANRWYCFNRG